MACALAHGRDSLTCDSFCKKRHPNAGATWDGNALATDARRACYRNCIGGGAFEEYEGAETAESDDPYDG